jgi:hypothetical protein
MGNGNWSTNTYAARAAARAAAGLDPFAYDQHLRTMPANQRTVHPSLDPALAAGPASPFAGRVMRECAITDEHPEPTPIAVLFDQTGSMGQIPRVLQTKLAQLHGLLVRRGYATDPQLLFGAIGDANTGYSGWWAERAPLQVGQFESDNRMDEQLESIYLEGNGGGQAQETYELGAYFLARHTHLDCYEQQNRKGFAFLIGDERPYPTVSRTHVKRLIGDTLEADIPTAEIFRELERRYHVFFIFAAQGSYPAAYTLGSYSDPRSWRGLLGERALELEDADAVCELIAATVGLIQGTADLDGALNDLSAIGAERSAIKATGKALARISRTNGTAGRTNRPLPGLGG